MTAGRACAQTKWEGGASIETTAKRDGVDVEPLVNALNVAVQVAEGVCAQCGVPEEKKI